ncbi:DAK2 domain-containing protein [Gandjariella thermophila]|uniref:DAK2 domain-containing protein n=1 Tax=Gandjariella thermophila TaxID=1931992 RepID=UPI0010F64CFD|nr:DAK2 domain-containing protein [Gandjariella thermophila]
MQALDAAAVRRWAAACVDALDAQRDAIDRINVFPVADGDTGTNLLTTMRAALDALLRASAEDGLAVGAALAALAKGALAGARGNSGIILSQVFRGLAEAIDGTPSATGPAVRAALRRADELALAAVSEPVDGTVLSVLHAASAAAESCGSDTLAEVTRAAAGAAAEALEETPRQLAALARAGVVDAGGRGLVVLLDALAAVVQGREDPAAAARPVTPSRVARAADALVAERESGSGDYAYEVMYLLDGLVPGREKDLVTRLRRELAGLGDCVSVVGDGERLWSVHVHCNDVGAAIEAGIETGRPHRISVVRFADQITEAARADRFVRERAVVALVRGEGVAELFSGEGATVLPVDPARPPTETDLLAVLAGTRAAHLVVLPNDRELTTLAEAAAEQAIRAGQDVVVVPTASPVQGLAALAVHDSARRPGDDVVAMAEAAAATRRGEVVLAQREAITWAGRCQPGDVLGLLDGEVVLIEPRPAEHRPAGDAELVTAACRLADRALASGGELVTVLLGESAPLRLAGMLEEHLRHSHPEVELTVYPGGQPDAVVLLGVE